MFRMNADYYFAERFSFVDSFVSIVNFEHVIAGWVLALQIIQNSAQTLATSK